MNRISCEAKKDPENGTHRDILKKWNILMHEADGEDNF